MPDTVIVTIRYGAEEADFELPAKLPLGQWQDTLGPTLRLHFHNLRLEGRGIALKWQNRTIPAEATMENCGIYDGSILLLEVN